ncbi:MAG: hypothetical protein ABIO24_14825 [Saprospiraceae bacterium]
MLLLFRVVKSEMLATRLDEERRLEVALNEALAEHGRASAKLVQGRRTLPKNEYLMVQREAEIARLGSEAARTALESFRAIKTAVAFAGDNAGKP